jgi:Arc/MetJ family transcription regulator
MRTRIEIDQQSLAEAMAATGHTTKRATVEAALWRVVRLKRQKQAPMDMAGLGWEGDHSAMREGRIPEWWRSIVRPGSRIFVTPSPDR